MEAAESLFECLEQVKDPRKARGVRHPGLRQPGPALVTQGVDERGYSMMLTQPELEGI